MAFTMFWKCKIHLWIQWSRVNLYIMNLKKRLSKLRLNKGENTVYCVVEVNILGGYWVKMLWEAEFLKSGLEGRSRDLQIPDHKFLSTLFWLDPMGLASQAGRVALLTSFVGKEPHLKQWLVTCPRRFPNWDFPEFSSVVTQMPGNLLHSPRCPIITLIILSSSIDQRDRRDPRQMAYQAVNPWLRPKPVGDRRSFWAPQVLPGTQHQCI